jgi:hypothetical protein
MAYYMIHACNERIWYVKEYLLPSMLAQGIDANNIFIYRDKNKIGNLRAWVDSCNRLVEKSHSLTIDGVWHLQDDVVLSKDFKRQTELYDNGIVCGFTCSYDNDPKPGYFRLIQHELWYSFPCIRIPTNILEAFTYWANLNLWQSNHFKEAVKRNNCDDLIFREWLYENFPMEGEFNLAPNIVNHIDKWLGGSICNKQRDSEADTMSLFWEDNGELNELKSALDKRKNI